MAKSWKDTEISYLKRYAATKTADELARRFRTDAKTVSAKLAELGVAAKGEAAGSGPADPGVEAYEKGLKKLYEEKWKAAAELLGKVREQTDQPELAARAAQLLAVCEARLAETAEGEVDDPYLAAVYWKNRGRLEKALELCEKADRGKDDERFAYLAASIHSLAGRLDEAEKALTRAIELDSKNRVHAHHDPDFDDLRQSQEHAHLFAVS